MADHFDYNDIAERYIASWNEPDPETRKKLVEELWAEDCTYYNRLFVVFGREMMPFVVGRAHDEYYGKGFCFRYQNNAYGHHGGMRFHWVMVSSATGEVDTFGEDFVILDKSGRIRVDYQFAMKKPSV